MIQGGAYAGGDQDRIATLQSEEKGRESPALLELYDSTIYSFQFFLQELFPGYVLYEGDPLNEKRKKAITLIDNNSLYAFRSGAAAAYEFITLSSKEFEELADLVLYQNAVDISYKEIPPSLRQEANRMMRAMQRTDTQKADIEQLIDICFLYLRDMEQVMNLPVRKFYNLIDNIRRRQEYEIYSNPMFSVKDLKHWMFGGYDRNPYKGILQREEDAMKQLDLLKK